MSDVAVAVAAGLMAGFVGAVAGTAWMWSALRARMDAHAAELQEPRTDRQQLESLRTDLHQLAHQQATQEDIQVKRLYQWQCDFMRFVDESQKRHATDGGTLPQAVMTPTTATATATAEATTRPRGDIDVPRVPDKQIGAADSSSTRTDAPATRELTDAEIDALPPELPEPTRRKRPARTPVQPTMRGL